jgi:hypothetical protein
MRFRKLRIAWSVGIGIAFALLIVLWARSYSFVDQYYHHVWAKWLLVQSREGQVLICLTPASEVPQDHEWWGGQTIEIWGSSAPASELPFCLKWFMPFHEVAPYQDLYRSLIVPHWFLVALSAIFAIAPYAPWKWRTQKMRFSLRSLLIATALIAVVLALAIYAAKHDF